MKQHLPWAIAGVSVLFAIGVLLFPRLETWRTSTVEPVTNDDPAISVIHDDTGAPGPGQIGMNAGGRNADPSGLTGTPAAAVTGGNLLAGIVTDLELQPLPDATIRGIYEVGGSKMTVEGKTNAAGKFRIPNVPVAELKMLLVEAPGYGRTQIPNLPLPIEDLEIALNLLSGAELHVAVQDDQGAQRPFSGDASLTIYRQTPAQGTTETAGVAQINVRPGEYVAQSQKQERIVDGHLQLDGLDRGIYKVGVQAGEEYAESQPFRVEEGLGAQVEVTLGVRRSLAGYVKAQTTQQPIERAQVQAQLGTGGAIEAVRQTQTDRQGRFQIDGLSPGNYTLSIAAAGYTTKTVENAQVSASNEPAPENTYLLVQGQPALVVTVIDGEGRPVSRAPLVIFATGTAQPRTYFSRTDAAGVARIDNVFPGTYTVAVTAPDDRTRQKTVTIQVPEGGENRSTVVSFGNLVKVSGSVRYKADPTQTLLSFTQRGEIGTKQFAKSDAMGNFTVELEPGEYMVQREGQPGSTVMTVPPGQAHAVDLNLI